MPKDLKEWMEDKNIPFDINEFEFKKSKILIVDDDLGVRNYLKKVLSGIFIHLDFATDGFEAGKKIIQFNPELIILDLFMPNMNGFDVCQKIKSDPSTEAIKILILSGQLTDENQNKVLSLGADAVLTKPSSKKVLLDCVERLLKSYN